MEGLQYPIGRFEHSPVESASQRSERIQQIADLPRDLERAVRDLTRSQLDTAYREGGWTLRQVVHHVLDSHLNAYGRFRFALTEDEPTIMPYDEASWAELDDARTGPVEPSLEALGGLHARWAALLASLQEDLFARTLRHPDIGIVTLDWLLDQYAWHGRHHVAHVTATRSRLGW